MEGADHNVEGDPGDEEPAGPVAAVEHEDARDDLQYTREMDVPVAYQITATHHSTQQRYATEYDKEPTNDRDRDWASWHGRYRLALNLSTIKERAASQRERSQSAATEH